MAGEIRVLVWNEFEHERRGHAAVLKHYPQGIHQAIAAGLEKAGGLSVRTATLPEPEHGLTEEALAGTDVLFWWAHMAHAQVQDAVVRRVQRRVLEGMGLVVLHSGHFSKIFQALMGTHCSLKWREAHEREIVWNIAPDHPIAEGVPDRFDLPEHEMYGERFDIPEPDQLVFLSWFEGGNVFRSGCTFRRGNGKIFYFSPGHETYPVYHMPVIQRILANAARWAHTPFRSRPDECVNETAPSAPIAPKA